MKRDFEYSLLESGESIKKGYSLLLQNAGKAIAILTGFIAVLVTFTEVGFCKFDIKSITSNALVMLVSSYMIFFSLSEAGEKLGRQSKEYKSAEGLYAEKRGMIKGEDMPALREFCRQYTLDEHKFRIELKLSSYGYSLSEYSEYKCGKSCTGEAKRVFKRIDRIKPLHLTPTELLGEGKRQSSPEFKNPIKWHTARMIIKLIPSTLCMLFTLTLMLRTKDGLGFAEVAEGLLKLSALPVIGLKGYSGGYSFVKNDAVLWLQTKTRLLEAFVSSNEVCN